MSALSLTADAIPCLCNLLDPPPSGYCPVLQVLNVSKIKRNVEPGSFLYRIVLSDGTFYCDGSIAIPLHHLVEEGVLETFSYIRIKKFVPIDVQATVALIVLELLVLQNVKFPWGTPCRFSAPIDLQKGKCKSSDPLMVVRNHFFVRHTEESKDDTDSVSCGTCNGKPCDWTKYGADIVGFVTQICEADELKHNHKNKRFLSFSGYSAWKHGYHGRNNRVKVPLCVEVGIQSSYVEKDGNYVGFRSSKDD